MINNKRKIENIALTFTILLLCFFTYYTLQNFNNTSKATINAINEQNIFMNKLTRTV